MGVITLTTDFGTSDWFVGTMKGVILSVNPSAAIVDITHELPAGDIHAGAFALTACHAFFPRGPVHVAVVDPGVGSERDAIVLRTRNHVFVGPDNGVLSLATDAQEVLAIHRIENKTLFRNPVSSSFHGRDVFAPVAAHLCRGTPIQKVGPRVKDFVKLNPPLPRAGKDSIRGEVIYVDRFGNAITNIDSRMLSGLAGSDRHIAVRGRRICELSSHYAAVAKGKPVALINSCNLLEIAVNGGSAAHRFRLNRGTIISIRAGS
jgi:S-adenosylmethionine hydrolase